MFNINGITLLLSVDWTTSFSNYHPFNVSIPGSKQEKELVLNLIFNENNPIKYLNLLIFIQKIAVNLKNKYGMRDWGLNHRLIDYLSIEQNIFNETLDEEMTSKNLTKHGGRYRIAVKWLNV